MENLFSVMSISRQSRPNKDCSRVSRAEVSSIHNANIRIISDKQAKGEEIIV